MLTLRTSVTSILAIVYLLMLGTTTQADDQAQIELAWEELRNGRAVAIMRHALAPGFSDPANFDIDDCATQRNLSDEGRDQARSAGELFRSKGIETATVISSEWCRCMETAKLLELGSTQPFPALNSFFENRATREEQTNIVRSALPQWLGQHSEPTVLVTHQVNITALTGSFAGSGEILIITLADNQVEVLANIPTLN